MTHCDLTSSSVDQAHYKSSWSPNPEVFDMSHHDTTERAYKQNKSTQQKQYRDREIDGFADLREAIRESTDDQEPPRTKYEILSKASRHIRQLDLMNKMLQQQLHMLKSSRINDKGCMVAQTQAPATSLQWNGDVKSVGTYRATQTQIVSQSSPYDFYIGMGSGMCDTAMLESAPRRDQTSTVLQSIDDLNQIDQYYTPSFGHCLNQPESRISYNKSSYYKQN
ncbi:uncharacterized protein EDB93DRAFT_1247063 [Suillus bovinus]|uniref:uncharacterized protein n=1 Tax=Suillus bovinus TaxID=48563 RepID=UPI001B87411B|nr:uncharacterized protein EDB93DRAFT_1247063 [Suillus bovinus]KAG2156874.1 hypothetical protein EDB93DRAFT_1247063 [Suillus bovinus]